MHCFHQECIEGWIHSHSTCPYCRNNLRLSLIWFIFIKRIIWNDSSIECSSEWIAFPRYFSIWKASWAQRGGFPCCFGDCGCGGLGLAFWASCLWLLIFGSGVIWMRWWIRIAGKGFLFGFCAWIAFWQSWIAWVQWLSPPLIGEMIGGFQWAASCHTKASGFTILFIVSFQRAHFFLIPTYCWFANKHLYWLWVGPNMTRFL